MRPNALGSCEAKSSGPFMPYPAVPSQVAAPLCFKLRTSCILCSLLPLFLFCLRLLSSLFLYARKRAAHSDHLSLGRLWER